MVTTILYSQSKVYLSVNTLENDIILNNRKLFPPSQLYVNFDRYKFKKDTLIEVDTPTVMLISSYRCSFLQRVFMTAGDSLVVSEEQVEQDSTKYYLKFLGKNAGNYNYYAQEDYALKEFEHWYTKGEQLDTYKEHIQSWRDKRLAFLEQFIKANQVTEEFIEYIRADIQNSYVFYLYDPLIYNDVDRELLPLSYFDDTFIIADDRSQYYEVASNLFMKYKSQEYTSPRDLYKYIATTFNGKQQDYLIATLIGVYALKLDKSYSEELNAIIDQALTNIQDSAYIDYIKHARDYYMVLDQPFPDNVLDSTFCMSYGKTDKISLRDVLNIYKGKPVYLDIWASWCGPCRDDISKSKEVKEYLHSQGVEYLYLSVDQKAESWTKASEEDGITKNQFLLCDFDNSALPHYLSFNYIPFYVILNDEHKIKTTNGPKPIPDSLDEIKKLINSIQMKTITF